MFAIKGEGLFVGAGMISEGWKIAENLRKIGFKVTPVTNQVFSDEKRYYFVFEANSADEGTIWKPM